MSESPAGWYPDNQNPSIQRWWDGAQWTGHVSPPVAPTMPTVAITRQHKSTNHILHLILSIITGGLWIPVWIIVTMKHKTTREQIVTSYR